MASCAICGVDARLWRVVDGYDYFDCDGCGSIAIDSKSLALVDAGHFPRNYDPSYWEMEDSAARQRSWGPSLARLAESMLYNRRPVRRFIDLGRGPGYLLDALSTYLPSKSQDIFFAVEKYPPARHTAHPGYVVGDISEMEGKFDGGVCIEVIEHLTPKMLDLLLSGLAEKSEPQALYVFNTGLPHYVKNEDPAYMDPIVRGHIISWGWGALNTIFGKHGFKVLPVGNKSFAFAAEYQSVDEVPLTDRIWTVPQENRDLMSDAKMGEVMFILGLESARAYA